MIQQQSRLDPLGTARSHFPLGTRALPLKQSACFPLQAVAAPAQMTTEEYATKYGFEVLKTEFIPEYNSNATLFRHKKTNAEVSGFLGPRPLCLIELRL
jgi:hypothetical protein